MRTLTGAGIGALLIAILAGCATGGGAMGGGNPEKRAAERWDAIIEGDYSTAYGYLTPGFRSGTTEAAWIGRQERFPAKRKSFELLGSDCESAEVCDVRLSVEAELVRVLPGVDKMDTRSIVTETWLLLDGQWYLAPDYR